MLLSQEHFDEFFKRASGGEKGTLFYLKNLCNFRNVKADISDNFSHFWELMCQNTEAFVTLPAKELSGIENTSDRPENPPVDIETESKEKRKEYMDAICQKITSHVWHQLNTDALKVEATGIDDLSLYCCNENFIGCEKRGQCLKGQWFHYSCAGVDPENLPNT
ncbi:uncharacterized protein LOC124277378 [Haliotis rubra]|uniref:uncharacterized protein LOC124277378 n=1 Tax=Haliotis rubra TaxID=36100 RepID=UPI001EE5787A|nr:uncharacterized protein LOC124277378 [Haliotis rubra]